MKAYGTRSTKTTWSNPERGLLQRSKRICVKDCDSIFLRKIRFTPFPTGKRLHGLHNFDQRIVHTFWARMIRQFPWLNSKDLGTEVNHTWGAWDGLADKVHECIQLENDNPHTDWCARKADLCAEIFECIFAQISRGRLGSRVRCLPTMQNHWSLFTLLQCFTYLYISLYIFIYLYISLHIFTSSLPLLRFLLAFFPNLCFRRFPTYKNVGRCRLKGSWKSSFQVAGAVDIRMVFLTMCLKRCVSCVKGLVLMWCRYSTSNVLASTGAIFGRRRRTLKAKKLALFTASLQHPCSFWALAFTWCCHCTRRPPSSKSLYPK